MAYDDEQARRSRVVVETPTARREVTHTEAVRNDRGGMSGATVGVVVVVAIALITIVVLFLMNGPTDTTNSNLAETQPATQQPPVIVQQPAPQQQPPVIIQQPAPAGQAPVIIQQAPSAGGAAPAVSQDGSIQAAIDKKLADDPTLSSLGIIATVLDGKVTITGTVKSEALKAQVERAIRAISGVKQVDNQIVAMG
ncbi:MAG TPA: BON domain-containing protein [Pyrinomonadaceae bacterium]|nr:BON domain-containing protein [Pyrinomonadaceae bacterium]